MCSVPARTACGGGSLNPAVSRIPSNRLPHRRDVEILREDVSELSRPSGHLRHVALRAHWRVVGDDQACDGIANRGCVEEG